MEEFMGGTELLDQSLENPFQSCLGLMYDEFDVQTLLLLYFLLNVSFLPSGSGSGSVCIGKEHVSCDGQFHEYEMRTFCHSLPLSLSLSLSSFPAHYESWNLRKLISSCMHKFHNTSLISSKCPSTSSSARYSTYFISQPSLAQTRRQ